MKTFDVQTRFYIDVRHTVSAPNKASVPTYAGGTGITNVHDLESLNKFCAKTNGQEVEMQSVKVLGQVDEDMAEVEEV